MEGPVPITCARPRHGIAVDGHTAVRAGEAMPGEHGSAMTARTLGPSHALFKPGQRTAVR
ncbi:hypothetical protein XspCFBP7912_02570 [Xanthomonas sp. CFBP 7912]|nr:hypothetical protein XspCFBP7912_02570 [Xanthomonas sp. CFBP 7912]RJS02869.1 hypothetical protein XnspCFBP7698_14920 [Xanthomonas sp. CFBP 7698]